MTQWLVLIVSKHSTALSRAVDNVARIADRTRNHPVPTTLIEHGRWCHFGKP